MRKLLYIDSSYTLGQLRERGLSHVLAIRLLGGYFDRAWSAHPVDMHPALHPGVDAYGPPQIERVADNHLFVRGRFGRFRRLARIAPLNAIIALFSFTWMLTSLARREQIGVVRAGDPLLCGLIGLIVSRMAGAKLVVRINGDHDALRQETGHPIMPNLFRTGRIEDWVERLVLRRANHVIVPSPNYGEFAQKKGTAANKITVVRYGNLIDPRHLAAPETRPLPEDSALVQRMRQRPWMVHVGRLHEIKRPLDCLEVLERLAKSGSNAGLCLVGDGPLRGAIAARAAEAGLTDRVMFLGNVDQDFLSRLLPLCAVVLSPLTGRALTETAFAALPIVAYDVDWHREMVTTDATGILVPGQDIEAMAQGVRRFLDDPAYARRMGAGARQRAFDLLSPDAETQREIEAYRSLEALP